MYIILNYSRAYFTNAAWEFVTLAKTLFFGVFPFLKYSHESERKGNCYENRGDYLFLPEIFSTKKYLYPETISLGISLVVFFFAFVIFLTFVFNTSAIVIIFGLVALLYFTLMLFKIWIVYNALSYTLIDFTKEDFDRSDDVTCDPPYELIDKAVNSLLQCLRITQDSHLVKPMDFENPVASGILERRRDPSAKFRRRTGQSQISQPSVLVLCRSKTGHLGRLQRIGL